MQSECIVIQNYEIGSVVCPSLAWRLAHINSVILSYTFMIYKWPSSLLKSKDRTIRNFLWSGNIDTKKMVNVAWSTCCLPKDYSGLGVKSLKLMNRALLKKLSWKFITNDSFVFSFSRTRYLSSLSKVHRYYIASLIWSGIKDHYSSLLAESRWIIGEQSKVHF